MSQRTVRFKEAIFNIQVRMNYYVDVDVIKIIEDKIRRRRNNTNVQDINLQKLKIYLKQLNLTQYYELAPFILYKIKNGVESKFDLPIEKFLEMFQITLFYYDVVKNKICPNRQGFLSEYFLCYKFSELLGLNEYKEYFGLTFKNAYNKKERKIHENIWSELVKYLKKDQAIKVLQNSLLFNSKIESWRSSLWKPPHGTLVKKGWTDIIAINDVPM